MLTNRTQVMQFRFLSLLADLGMVSFVLHPMESISLNSFVLLEHLAMLLTSTLAINC